MPSRPCLVCGELTPRGSWCRAHEPKHDSPSHLLNRTRAARKLRHEAMIAAQLCCQNCGATGYLELHHIVPVAAGGKHELSNVRVLCAPCHDAAGRAGAQNMGPRPPA